MQKLLSNREIFRHFLARDITAILEDVTAGTWVDVHYLRGALGTNSLSARHYMDLHTAQGHCFTDFSDRFYRALQSINDKGYGLTISKDKQTNRLFVVRTKFEEKYVEALADKFEDCNNFYKSKTGYEINNAKDEVASLITQEHIAH